MNRIASLATLALLFLIASYKIATFSRKAANNSPVSQQEDFVDLPRPGSLSTKASGIPSLHEGARPTINSSVYPLFRDDGLINQELLSLGGIPESKSDLFGSIVGQLWDNLAADIERRAILIENEAGAPQDQRTYIIPSDNELATRYRDNLSAELSSNFGEAAARILTPYLSSPQSFAGFGELETKLTLRKTESMGNEVLLADFTNTDPESGKILFSRSTTDPLKYKRHFGHAFIKTMDSEED